MSPKSRPIRFLFPYGHYYLEYSRPCLAHLFTVNHTVDLLSGKRSLGGAKELCSLLAREKLYPPFDKGRLKVFHLFYELGYIFQNLEELLQEDQIMGIALEFSERRKIDSLAPFSLMTSSPTPTSSSSSSLPSLGFTLKEKWSWDKYKEKFKIGNKHLQRGDCYQYNLTTPFYFERKDSVQKTLELEDFAVRLWTHGQSTGAYAHLTDFGQDYPWGRFFLSNSPECLFQAGLQKKAKIRLETMPIKGTLPLKKGSNSLRSSWKQLNSSLKDECELFMIVDLLRNDFSAIAQEFSEVVKKKSPLQVQGLLHQYAKIALETKENLDLLSILKSVFPGGSITGVPKKRVMKILSQLEGRSRGLYCGSTIVLSKKIQAASLNIRSAVATDSSLLYQAGGGITLLSRLNEEYREMNSKVESFMDLLN